MSLMLDCFILGTWDSVATVTVIPYELVAGFTVLDVLDWIPGLFFRLGSSEDVINGVLKSSSSLKSLKSIWFRLRLANLEKVLKTDGLSQSLMVIDEVSALLQLGPEKNSTSRLENVA